MALQGLLMGRGMAGGHSLQPAIMGTPKVGPNSTFVRAGSMLKDWVVAKGAGILGSSKIQSLNVLVIGQGCGPKGCNLSLFQGLAAQDQIKVLKQDLRGLL